MQINHRLRAAQVSGTVRLAQLARDLAATGRDVIDLAEGEPDFDTPPHIVAAAHAAALAGDTRYTPVAGTDALRGAIAKKFTRDTGIPTNPAAVIVGTGAKHLIFNALMATLEPGDEVIVPAPHWVSYPDMAALCGGSPVVVPCPAATGYKLTARALADAITPRTRWLILNSPGNPTGAVYSAAELGALADTLRTHPEVAVMCDDIYEAILFDGTPFATLAQVAPDLAGRVLTVNGVSKTYAMTGWRIGYATGPQDLIDAMIKLQGQQTTNAASVSQAAALAALTGPQAVLDAWRAAYARRRGLVTEALGGIDGLHLSRPQGAFYVFADVSGLLGRAAPDGARISTDTDLSAYLLQSAGVALVPGTAFGAPGHLRLCFAKADADLSRACALLRDALAALEP